MSDVRVTPSFDYNAICDSCGLQYKASQLKKRWDGLMVCKDDWEQRHISDFYYTRNDTHILPYIRTKEAYKAVTKLGSVASTSSNGTTTVNIGHALFCTPDASFTSAFGAGLTSWTVQCWARCDALDNRVNTVFSTRNDTLVGSMSFGLGATGGNGVSMIIEAANGSIARGVGAPPDIVVGKWNHYTWMCNAGALSMYINGVPIRWQAGTSSNGFTWTAPTAGIYIGRAATIATLRAFVGAIRDVRVYKFFLSTPALMRSIENQDNLTIGVNMIGWWKMDDVGPTYLDYQTNIVQNTLTNSGTDAIQELATY